jgi:Alpha-L-fucosidase./Beta-galactosidase trimerisation domain.
MFELSPRQIHLDFHTSEFIPGIGSDFDPKEFAETAKKASITSMTVFARCHHGWMYYDSAKFPGSVHPELANKNLLIDQVKALHAEGIKAPIYITVQIDYQSAKEHPEWLVRDKNGAHLGGPFYEAGFWKCLCVNTGYYDFLEAHTVEICKMLGDELDGVFFDIVSIRPCYCKECSKEMKAKGVNIRNDEEVRKFAKATLDTFKIKLSKAVREVNDKCSIFYNAGHIGPSTKETMDTYTHFELESLPSGGWGYLHFPATVRYARTLGFDCMGMTGKFHLSWADFHSLKNQAALEFECFRILSFGCACSIGDQLEPNGKINQATYDLIGSVYNRMEEYEQYARPAIALSDIALITDEPVLVEHKLSDELLGACQMFDELALQYDIIDRDMDFTAYKLIVLSDNITIDECYAAKLDKYVADGGKVISAMNGGLYNDSKYPTLFGIDYVGKNNLCPDFLIADGVLADGLANGAEYVIYMQGIKLKPNGAEVIMNARAPYFKRDGEYFCSHSYTPSAKGEAYPSVFRNGNVISFSHPIFAQYRNNAPNWCKRVIKNALDLLLPNRLIKHNGPSTLTVTVLDQPEKKRATIHVLSYIPVRKSATIDIIEERTPAYNVDIDVNLPYKIKNAKSVVSCDNASYADGKISIPKVDGYEIIVLEY